MASSDIGQRRTFYIVDELGVDPLLDTSIDAILSVERYTLFEVAQTNEFNLPLIAERHYSDSNWWWIILQYNGITDPFSVKRGDQLKMPGAGDITSALSKSLLEVTTPRIINI